MTTTLRLAALTLLLSACASQDHGASHDAEAMPSPEEMMVVMEAYRAVGPHHQRILEGTGTYDVEMTMWMDPSAPPELTRGRAVLTSEFGGRFVREVMDAEMMGMPFHGMGYHGYDNAAGMHVSSWMDDMGTGIYVAKGRCDGECRRIEFDGSGSDPMTGGVSHFRYLVEHQPDGSVRFTMFMVPPDGGEPVKQFQSVYRRV